jgi:hypothetical protein
LRTDLKLRTLHYLETLKKGKKRQTKPICHHGYAIILDLKDYFLFFIYLFSPPKHHPKHLRNSPPTPAHSPKEEKKRRKKKPPSCHTCGLFFSSFQNKLFQLTRGGCLLNGSCKMRTNGEWMRFPVTDVTLVGGGLYFSRAQMAALDWAGQLQNMWMTGQQVFYAL